MTLKYKSDQLLSVLCLSRSYRSSNSRLHLFICVVVMRCLAVCGLLVLLSLSVQCQSKNAICEIFTETKEDGFKFLALVALAQNLPNSEIGETVPLLKEAVDLGVKCCSDAPTEDCNSDVGHVFQSALCSSESLVEKNNLKLCCDKTGTERADCFIDHKSKIPQDLSLKAELPASDQCEDFNKNNNAFIGRFVFHFSKLIPTLQPYIIKAISEGYFKVLTTCCAEAEAQTCLDNKKTAFQNSVRTRVLQLMATCDVYKKYGERILKAKKMVQYSQKIPQASFQEMSDIVKKIVATYDSCCSGKVVNCMKERKELADQVCSDQSLVSRTVGLAECCSKSVMIRGSCVEAMKPDDKPDHLLEHYNIHADMVDICKNFNENPELAMGKILHEVSTRHPESSQQLLLRFAKEAEQALMQCCDKEDHTDCVKTALGERDLHKSIKEEGEYYNNMCTLEKTVGEDNFEKRMMVYYTQLMPQASFEKLHLISETVHGIVYDCCHNNPGHSNLHCIDEKLTNTLDATCHEHDPTTVSVRVAHCCNQSYSMRRPCIFDLKPDTEFTPPELDAKNFNLSPELCKQNPKELLVSGKKLLYGVVRHKTTITDDELKTISAKYHTLRNKCCAAEDQETCFNEEKPKLIAESAELLKS
ncbi:hypothetical protein UPYG_G00132170 [Umbra pygmaea]|uniref:Albumin domain-containing protein n=1 Tax=Umbra pygmaea TaxID=75934 RepID=A0ABD0WTC9_UMBPY